MAAEKLALDGGTPVRTTPLPSRKPFGDKEIELATQALRSQNLFRWGGAFVPEFEKRFAELYGAAGAAASDGRGSLASPTHRMRKDNSRDVNVRETAFAIAQSFP